MKEGIKQSQNVNQRYFSFVDLMTLEQRYRAAFINSLTGFKSISLIGTKSTDNRSNLAIFNSIVHIGANPPYIGFISRPDSVDRHTLRNILETGYYTINHVNNSIYAQAHQTSARYDDITSEFSATGLNEHYLNDFHAPYVLESEIKIGVRFIEQIPIKINGTIMVVGRIEHVHFPMDCLCRDGFLDIEKAGSIAGAGLDSYHETKRINRLSYAKAHKQTEPIALHYIPSEFSVNSLK